MFIQPSMITLIAGNSQVSLFYGADEKENADLILYQDEAASAFSISNLTVYNLLNSIFINRVLLIILLKIKNIFINLLKFNYYLP